MGGGAAVEQSRRPPVHTNSAQQSATQTDKQQPNTVHLKQRVRVCDKWFSVFNLAVYGKKKSQMFLAY